MGLTFRNNESFGDNADRILCLQNTYRFTLAGYFDIEGNGSTLIANGAVDWINAIFASIL
jgi:hypothetical protein